LDIEEHLALHDSAIRAWVGKNIMSNPDLADDAYQNIVLFMIELHESGTYDHAKSQLYTYVFPYLRAIAFKGIDPEGSPQDKVDCWCGYAAAGSTV
jgi:hypothetical protein